MLQTATFSPTCLVDLDRAGGTLLPMKAWINFNLTPSHNSVFSCDVIISSDLLIIDMHQQGSQFFIVSEGASMARHAKQKLKAHTIVQFHVAGKLFVQYVNYVNKCWKLDSIARSLFIIRVHVPCTKLYSFVPKYLSFYKFKRAYFRVQIHSFCFVCVLPPFLNILFVLTEISTSDYIWSKMSESTL